MSTGRVATQRTALSPLTTKTSQLRGTPPAALQHTGDRQTQDLQTQLHKAVQAMKSHPHGDGLFVQAAQAFTAGGIVTLNHGLGRAFRGYEAKNVTGAYSRFIVVPNSTSTLNAMQIQIQSEAACTADIWVF